MHVHTYVHTHISRNFTAAHSSKGIQHTLLRHMRGIVRARRKSFNAQMAIFSYAKAWDG